MIKLKKSLDAWQTEAFNAALKHEIEQLDAAALPLQQALTQSSFCSDKPFKVMLLRVTEQEHAICIKTGIFYSGIIAGCNCADDPTPVDELPEYCELEFVINKVTAETQVKLLSE